MLHRAALIDENKILPNSRGFSVSYPAGINWRERELGVSWTEDHAEIQPRAEARRSEAKMVLLAPLLPMTRRRHHVSQKFCFEMLIKTSTVNTVGQSIVTSRTLTFHSRRCRSNRMARMAPCGLNCRPGYTISRMSTAATSFSSSRTATALLHMLECKAITEVPLLLRVKFRLFSVSRGNVHSFNPPSRLPRKVETRPLVRDFLQ